MGAVRTDWDTALCRLAPAAEVAATMATATAKREAADSEWREAQEGLYADRLSEQGASDRELFDGSLDVLAFHHSRVGAASPGRVEPATDPGSGGGPAAAAG